MMSDERSAGESSGGLSGEIRQRLRAHGITTDGEAELRALLEDHVATFTLYRLAPAARRRWKARYRIMFGATYLDSQTTPEAYARALLAVLDG